MSITYYELDLAASYELFTFFEGLPGHVLVGYRLIDVDYEYDDGGSQAIIDADFSGPYVGLTPQL